MEQLSSVWKGSKKTAEMVRREIFNRWGKEAAQEYDPRKNCFTYKGWLERGFQVKRGENAITSITYVSIDKDDDDSDESGTESYPKTVYLFYKTQVVPIE